MASKRKVEKKKPETWLEFFLRWLSVLGAVLVLASLVPAIPWRRAAIAPGFGPRFGMDRRMSMLFVSNHISQDISWSTMMKNMCMKSKEFSAPDPISALTTLAASKLGANTLGGCGSWKECKDHTIERCTAYTTIAYIGLGAFGLNIIGIILAAGTVMTQMMEGMAGSKKTKKKKKEEEKEEAKFYPMCCSIACYATTQLGHMLWMFTTQVTFKGLQSRAYYPYPAASAGAYLNGFGVFFLFLAMFCGVNRLFPMPCFRESEPEKPENEEEFYGDGAYDPNAFMIGGTEGAPPGMGHPGFGYPGMGPPGMGPPGMGPPGPPAW